MMKGTGKSYDKGRFIFIALMCALETFYLNDCVFEGDYLFAFFWGFLLYRDLRHVYLIDKVVNNL